ncbi:MAG: Fpg/Nei family DNA glycosylase [Spirochaetales bacterium]
MPELPDVAIQKQYLDATALHAPIVDVIVKSKKIIKGVSARRFRSALVGAEFASSSTYGKYLFVALENNRKSQREWLMLHFGMTGFLEYGKERFGADDSSEQKHARLEVTFRNGYHLSFVNKRLLGKASLIESPESFIEKKRLGPDAMKIAIEHFRTIVSEHSAAIKSTLMNQKYICGLGNVYTDEILYHSGIHPERKSDGLSEDEVSTLYEAMHEVVAIAIEHKADPSKMPDDFLLPHREEGETCPRCRGTIEKIKVNGRSTYVCPACQKR